MKCTHLRVTKALNLSVAAVLLLCVSTACDTTPEEVLNWTVAELPLETGVIMSGVQTDSGAQFVVGGYPDFGMVLKKTDAGWQQVATFDQMLHWIHATEDTLWVVGARGLMATIDEAGNLTEGPWSETELELWGVYAVNDSDIWIVGGQPRAAGETHAIILRYKNDAWEVMVMPELDRPCPSLFKVWARDENDVYFVGANGVLLHFDGERIRQRPLDIGDDLVALWGTQDSLVIVGGRTRGVVITEHLSEWKTHLLATTSGLNGVAIGARHTALVGHQGTVVRFQNQNFDSRIITRPVNRLLHGVFVVNQQDFVATGGTLDQPQPWQPILIESMW